MSAGTPVNRHWVIVLKDGTIAIDWGDGLFQDVRSGEFVVVLEKEISHHILDEELDWLIRIGRVGSYTRLVVNFHSLPERPQRTIE
jgi:hypothetical protein